jgi:hypothetical protein
MGSLPATPAYRLCLIDVGVDSSEGCCSVPSHRTGRRYFRLPFPWVQSPRDGSSVMVLTTRVPNGPNPPWRSPLLPRRAYRPQSYHGDYVFSCAGVAMSGGDEMDSSTLLSGAPGCMWPCPIMPGIQCRCLQRSRPM